MQHLLVIHVICIFVNLKREQIKDVANLVLLENENSKEELNLKEKYLKDIEKNHMKESKQSVFLFCIIFIIV